MSRRIPDWLSITFYALPLFFFPLSTAGASISMALFVPIYIASGHWRHWARIRQRSWALPLALLIGWSFLGLLWTEDQHSGFKYAGATAYGIYAFVGTTLPWTERWVKLVIRLFLAGLFLNAILALLITWRLLPWNYAPTMPYVGFADHIWWSMALTHALFWLLWDMRRKWNFSFWINLVLAGLFFFELALSPGRSGQLLFVLIMPVGIWLLYRGRWRRWALGVVAATIIALGLSPIVRSRLTLGISNLTQYIENPTSTTTSWGIRLATMWAGVEMFAAHPFVGVGTGDFRPTMVQLQRKHLVTETPGTINDSASNSYLSEAAVLGLPGLILLLWFLTSLTREVWYVRFSPQGWFVLGYLLIFWIGGLYNTLIWGYADAISIAIFSGLPLHRQIMSPTKS